MIRLTFVPRWGMAVCAIFALVPSAQSSPSRENTLPPYEILMTADVVARFDGVFPVPRWRPVGDFASPAEGRAAVFTIVSWNAYNKLGKYGDAREPRFMADMDQPPPGQYARALEDIAALAPGDIVRLCWMHIYVDDRGNRYPERPVVYMKKTTLPPGVEPPPPYAHPSPEKQPRAL